MILVNRNHPSIIIWSVCNEPFFSDEEVLPKARKLVKQLVEQVHALDPSRRRPWEARREAVLMFWEMWQDTTETGQVCIRIPDSEFCVRVRKSGFLPSRSVFR